MRSERLRGALKSKGLLIAGAFLLLLFVYSDIILGGYQLSFTNVMYQMTPWNSSGVETDGPVLSDVADSFLPSMYTAIAGNNFFGLWEPQIALGSPVDVSIWLYPLNYLFLLPLGAAMLLRTICEFLIALIGMYLLLRAFGCGKSAAFAAGAAYCFSSVIVMWLGWQHSDVAAFAPFAFFFFERFLNSKQIKYCFGLIASVFLMLVAGMPTYAGYFLYLLAAYVFFHTIWVYKKDIRAIAVVFGGTLISVILGVLCSLPYTMSLLSSLGGNGYMQSREGQATSILPWSYLHSLFFPYLRPEGNTIHMNESTIYVGLAAILLFFFTALYFRRKKRMIFWCAALGVVFLLIFTPALDFIFTRLPAVNSSIKFRVITLFNFIMIVLMGLNINDLLANRKDYISHKGRTLLALGAGTALLAGVFIYTYQNQAAEDGNDILRMYFMIVILLVCLIIALLVRKIPTRFIGIGICLVIAFDMGSFAKEYFPLVEQGAPAIPEATDTIAFLQENTEYERFAATGDWTMFPNTNVLYGLEDIRAHNFVFTNADMSTYYSELATEAETTPTRYMLRGEINEPLLQYLGVKYLVEGGGIYGNFRVPGAINTESVLSQEYIFTHDMPQALVVLFGTYQSDFVEGEVFLLSITENESGETIYENTYDLSTAQDNEPYVLLLEDNTLEAGIPYTLTFSADVAEGHAITLWMDTENPLPTEAYYGGDVIDLDLAMRVVYGDVCYAGSDGLLTIETKSYTQRVELADTVRVFEDSDEVLEKMSQAFVSNTAFLTEEEAKSLSLESIGALADGDTAEITARTDDSVTVSVRTQTPKLLMLNEYYDDGWTVYVDGKEQPLAKCNYLFRAVEVPAGECTVEFQYKPKLLYTMFYVAGAGFLMVILLIVFRKRIQNKIEKIG